MAVSNIIDIMTISIVNSESRGVVSLDGIICRLTIELEAVVLAFAKCSGFCSIRHPLYSFIPLRPAKPGHNTVAFWYMSLDRVFCNLGA